MIRPPMVRWMEHVVGMMRKIAFVDTTSIARMFAAISGSEATTVLLGANIIAQSYCNVVSENAPVLVDGWAYGMYPGTCGMYQTIADR